MKRNMKKNTLSNALVSFYKGLLKIQIDFFFTFHGYIIVKKMNPKSFLSEKCEKFKTFIIYDE